MSRNDPRARDRIIGAKLRAIRTDRADISLERAAEMAGWAPSRLSRTERGLRQVTIEEVATLLTAWRIPVREREEMLADVQAGASSGWWDRPLPGVPSYVGALASYEADATELVNVAIAAVPGLLHTYETAIAVMQAGGASREDAETGWMVRLRRQQILGVVEYSAFITESALRRPFGGPKALRGQLEHLLVAQDRGMGVRVIPAQQTTVLLLHSWMWMAFPNTKPVVHVELASGAFFLHDDDVAHYTKTLDRLGKLALSRDESRKLISGLTKEL